MEATEGTKLLARNTIKNRCRIIDYSEILIISCIILSTLNLIYSIIINSIANIVFACILVVGTSVSECRVRRLGLSRKLMDSVDVLDVENKKLKEENEKLSGIVKLVGENVEDLEQAKKDLFVLYDKYKQENYKHQSNNLLTLFGLVDKNNDSKLSPEEMKRLSEYIKIVYKTEFDFTLLDKDSNGYVSLEEFFNKFKYGVDIV